MKKVHLICNAHIDPIWQWELQEGVSATLSTFRTAVRLAEKYDYIFCHIEVTVYKYVEEYDPELFEDIKRLVKSGKWRIMGGWYLQPDCNMPSGESIVRQILMGKKYFLETFGKWSDIAVNVDPFGHSRGLVQIMNKCGQSGYLVVRPNEILLPLESPQFIWEGFDGSIVKVFRAVESYSTPLGGAAKAVKERAKMQTEDTVCVLWGVGNHGGGPSEKDLSDLLSMAESNEDGYEYIHSYPEKFFEEIEPKRVVDKSLWISMPGCYTSMARIKREHIKLENDLYYAEIIASAAYAKGLMDYPSESIYSSAEDLMNGEFHDVLPGTCIKSGEDNEFMLFKHGLLQTDRVKTKAYFALCREQETAKDGEFPIIVFNPHPYEYTDNVECEFMLADQNWDEKNVANFRLYDENGNSVKFQVVKEESNINLDWRKKIIFEAKLKPLSLTRFSLYADFAEKPEKEKKSEFIYDDGNKYVEIDEKTGLLKSYKVGGKEYIQNGFAPMMFDDNPDPWGMGDDQQKRMGENGEYFAASVNPRGIFAGVPRISVIEDGEIYRGIETLFEKENTFMRIEYRIYKNSPAVDVNVNLFMGDVDKMLKLEIPVCDAEEVIGQAPYGTDKLFTDGRENVSQRFIAVKSGDKYLAVMNNCLYGSSFENGKLYLSLVRGTTYCAHPIPNRPILQEGRYLRKTDQGEHEFSFGICVCEERELERAATEFVRKPYALNAFPTRTERAKKNFDIRLSNKNVVLSAMKKSEDKDALILRLFNNSHDCAETVLTVNETELKIRFGKYEVKTVVFNRGELQAKNYIII